MHDLPFRPPTWPNALIFLAFLAGCSATMLPDGKLSPPDPPGANPYLIDLAPLLAQADAMGGDVQGAAAQTSALAGRIAALNGRAATLRGPIIDPATRARMLAGI